MINRIDRKEILAVYRQQLENPSQGHWTPLVGKLRQIDSMLPPEVRRGQKFIYGSDIGKDYRGIVTRVMDSTVTQIRLVLKAVRQHDIFDPADGGQKNVNRLTLGPPEIGLIVALDSGRVHPEEISPRLRTTHPELYWQEVINQARVNLGPGKYSECLRDIRNLVAVMPPEEPTVKVKPNPQPKDSQQGPRLKPQSGMAGLRSAASSYSIEALLGHRQIITSSCQPTDLIDSTILPEELRNLLANLAQEMARVTNRRLPWDYVPTAGEADVLIQGLILRLARARKKPPVDNDKKS